MLNICQAELKSCIFVWCFPSIPLLQVAFILTICLKICIYIYITYILWPKVQIINVGNSIGRLFVKDLIEAHGGHRTVSFQSIRQEAKIARQKAWKTKNNMYTDNGYSSEDVWILLEMGIFQCPINFQGS